nr:MAG TPA: hypothetical protein [Caudoviricetes sp.]
MFVSSSYCSFTSFTKHFVYSFYFYLVLLSLWVHRPHVGGLVFVHLTMISAVAD